MMQNSYLQPLIRWWRLIAILVLLALAASAISSMFQPDLYLSKTTLIVGSTFLDPNPNSAQIVLAGQLADIYADMALREPVQIATTEALGIDWLPQYNAAAVEGTQLLGNYCNGY
jgi:capsular polysaccharide biosynthesis protein